MISFNSKLLAQTDTLVCDNGGFESGFDYYFGSFGTFGTGSDVCAPFSGIVPTTFSSTSLPNSRRFEIVSSGSDDLVGINRTKFGSYAARINHKYGQNANFSCDGQQEVNKITKRFRVTEENREFTVWYAAVLEYPTSPSHSNNQPFFSIKCDLAPSYNLCFDSDVLNCPESYTDSFCTFVPIKVLDWACHRVKITKDQIGNIATLDIVAADCGQGEHFGYAYIDGICEDCAGSSLGSGNIYDQELDENELGIDHYSCEGDTIKICGDYTNPFICGYWRLDSINVPNFTIYNLIIDTIHHTFCFKLSKDSFLIDTCRELFVELYFGNGVVALPLVYSNTIEICTDDYKAFTVEATIGSCQNNSTNSILSDDYYYVNVQITNILSTNTWTIERQLDNPYPNESGIYTIESGVGNSDFDLGPILIQEGSWSLSVNINGCIKTIHIVPPIHCSTSCEVLNNTKITNVTCISGNDTDPTNDTWTFKIEITSSASGAYFIDHVMTPKYFGTQYTISGGLISEGCKMFNLEYRFGGTTCNLNIIVCPPKPCSHEINEPECNLEAYVKGVRCNEEGDEFNFGVVVTPSSGGYSCYQSITRIPSANSNNRTGSISSIGTFDEDIYLKLYKCSTAICTCDNTDCFKFIYVPLPDCENLNYRVKYVLEKVDYTSDVWIMPNPVVSNELIFHSSLGPCSIDIINQNSQVLFKNILIENLTRINIELNQGIYFVRYRDKKGITHYLKFIKI